MVLLSVSTTAAAQAPRFSITGGSPCIYFRLQDALAAAAALPQPGNAPHIVVRAGAYNVLAAAGADGINIYDDVHIFGGDNACNKVTTPTWGQGQPPATVSYQSAGTRIFTVEPNIELFLHDFELLGGSAVYGGLVYVEPDGLLGLLNMDLQNGQASGNGGCVYASNGGLHAYNSHFGGCSAMGDGGAIYMSGGRFPYKT